MSLLFGVAGILVQFVYIIDWWHPLIITGTLVGIEDFIFGFTIGGIAAVIYEGIFKKKIKIRRSNKKIIFKRNFHLLLIGLLMIILFFGSFFLLKINSFYSSIIAFVIPTIIIWILRKDLIIDSLVTGFLLMIIAFPIFIIIELITPGWVNTAWFLENLSGILILKVPLEDLIWFFLAGTFIGPLYEFWQEGRLIKIKKKSKKK